VTRLARVLVADDDPSVQRTLKAVLATEGHEVFLAEDGAHALIAAHEHVPDVILLDLIMPIVDGMSALRLLKTEERTANIPVIIITGRSEAQAVRLGYDLGADMFLTKPFEPREVLDLVERVLIDRDFEE
jgi:DNA-binding response OmpR family regulator